MTADCVPDRVSAAESQPFLAQNGLMMLEFGDGQEEALREIFGPPRWLVEAVEEDYSRRPRIVIVRRGF